MTERRGGCGKGCLIALGIFAAVGLVCGGLLTLAGYSLWQNPEVRRGVAITGAAIEMSQEAMRAPGTAEIRAAGCRQAMVFTPELQARFFATVAPDAGLDEDPLHLVLCNMPHDATEIPSCEDVVRAYADALEEPPPEIAATVAVQRDGAHCEGVYANDGTFLREMDPERWNAYGRIGSPDAPPPTP